MLTSVKRILATIDEERVVSLLQAMVRIPSFTLEETKLALFLGSYMERAGLEVELQAVPIGNDAISVQPVGRLRGVGGGPSLLLSGHMDYIGLEEPEQWRHPPFAAVVEDGFIYGRGTKDEKGGICAAIAAAEAIAASGVRLKGNIVVAPVLGHKTKHVGGGIGARHLMASGIRADMAIVTENSDLGIATTCVGRVTVKLHIEGRASSFDSRGTDFYDLLSRLIKHLGPHYGTVSADSWLTFVPHPSYPGFPMLVYGGVEMTNRRCTLTLNIRIVPGQTAESVKADLERVLEALDKHGGGYWSSVQVLEPVRYPHTISEDDPLVQALIDSHQAVRGIVQKIGIGPRRGAVADSWFFIAAGLLRTVIYGPGSIGPDFPEIPDERIAIRDLVDCACVYALTSATLCEVA